jgi:hypothetical protein
MGNMMPLEKVAFFIVAAQHAGNPAWAAPRQQTGARVVVSGQQKEGNWQRAVESSRRALQ